MRLRLNITAVTLAITTLMCCVAYGATTSRLMPGVPKPANVLTVAKSGGDYPTVQAAVTAAVARGATLTNPYLIEVYPGVTTTTYIPAPGVTVNYLDIENLAGKVYTPIYGPWHGKGLVSLRCDDGANDWMAVDGSAKPGGGNYSFGGITVNGAPCTPWQYCRSKGVPFTLGIISSYVTGTPPSGYLTPNQLRTLAWEAGFEIACHSMHHTLESTPTTSTLIQQEIIDSKGDIENLPVTQPYPITDPVTMRALGVSINGFYTPGVWNNTADAYINSLAKTGKPPARALLENYAWVSAEVYPGTTSLVQRQRYWSSYVAMNTVFINPLIQDCTPFAHPNRKCVTTMLIHAIPTNFKSLIDTLVTARDAGKIALVTQSELWLSEPGQSIPATQKFYHPYGDIDSWAESGALGQWVAYYGNYYTGTGVSVEGASPNKWLQLTGASSYIQFGLTFPEHMVGTPMTLKFKIKAISASATVRMHRLVKDRTTPTAVSVQLQPSGDYDVLTLTSAAGEQTIVRRVVIPEWSNTNRVLDYQITNVNAGETVQIKDIELF